MESMDIFDENTQDQMVDGVPAPGGETAGQVEKLDALLSRPSGCCGGHAGHTCCGRHHHKE